MTDAHYFALWQSALPPDIAHDASRRAFEHVLACYREPQRHYHTLSHVFGVLDLAQQHRARIHDWPSVVLALFYHDAVYEPTRTDNEALSAAMAQQVLSAWLPAACLARITALILATRSHGAVLQDTDMAHFLAFDLAILAAPAAVYQQYTQQIRAEYAHVPDLAYQQGRIQVLQHFLSAAPLFACDVLGRDAEQTARHNLQTECEYWQIKLHQTAVHLHNHVEK